MNQSDQKGSELVRFLQENLKNYKDSSTFLFSSKDM